MKLAVRADASSKIGFGHAMRCLALIQEWKNTGDEVMMISRELEDGVEQLFKAERINVHKLNPNQNSAQDAAETAKIASHFKAVWIVLDGYGFDTNYQNTLRKKGFHLLIIDDYGHLKRYTADLILNQNASDENIGKLYRNLNGSRILAGTQYTLLRNDFLREKESPRECPAVARKILFTFGGSFEAIAVAKRVLESLIQTNLKRLELVVVIPGQSNDLEELNQICKKIPFSAKIVTNELSLSGLMSWAGLAVSGCGSTVWELAFMRVPSLLIQNAENQKLIADTIKKSRFGHLLGWAGDLTSEEIRTKIESLAVDQKTRKVMMDEGRQLVDGLGASRVVSVMKSYVNG